MQDMRSMVESSMTSSGIAVMFVGIENFSVDGSEKDHSKVRGFYNYRIHIRVHQRASRGLKGDMMIKIFQMQ